MEKITTYFVVEEKTCFASWSYIDTEQKLTVTIILEIEALVCGII